MAWLRKTAPEEPPEQKIERLMKNIHHSDPRVRRGADIALSSILRNDYAAYTSDFRVAVLEALAERTNPDYLERFPRYVLLLARPGNVLSRFGRPDPIQVAAQACLDRWQAKQDKQDQPKFLLRASENQGSGDTLLRPASGNPSTASDQLLRASEPEDQREA
jgi:hypothetical protein